MAVLLCMAEAIYLKKSEMAATIEALMQENQDLKEQLDMKISSCDALPLLRAKDEEIGQMQIIINRLRDDLEVAHAAKVHNDWR